MSAFEIIYATTVAIDGRGVLITGPSGSGKSDLALRLIDRGAVLVADDRTAVRADGGTVFASAPAMIAGRIEVRAVGIATLPVLADVPVALCLFLTSRTERLPQPRTRTVANVPLPEIAIDPGYPSAPIKVELMLRQPGMVVA